MNHCELWLRLCAMFNAFMYTLLCWMCIAADSAVWLPGHPQHRLSSAAHPAGRYGRRQCRPCFLLLEEETSQDKEGAACIFDVLVPTATAAVVSRQNGCKSDNIDLHYPPSSPTVSVSWVFNAFSQTMQLCGAIVWTFLCAAEITRCQHCNAGDYKTWPKLITCWWWDCYLRVG